MEAYKQEMVYTIEDIYALPDGERAELIDGQLYNMAPPSTEHQRILSRLHLDIANYIDSHHGECEIFPAPFAVFLNQGNNKNYVEPDLSVICDPDRTVVTVYDFKQDTMVEYPFGEYVAVGIYEDLSLKVM